MGQTFYDFSRGIDKRPVISEWERKSVSCEHTFETDINDADAVTTCIRHTVEELVRRIAKNSFEGRTLTMKIKFAHTWQDNHSQDFHQITRSMTASHILRTQDEILPLAEQLMQGVDYQSRPIRLLGLGVSNPGNLSTNNEKAAGLGANKQQQWVELELDFDPWPEEFI
jgi:DNA polymerase-4